ncbi:uncharacterized protein IWZ02DRAFT_459493 [Phyllosticta citriasiana]|uniref:uncharacterized protein n=1 Tax=Phyllosticta citriasiana TaxID=595635 RepID=UPI0030FD8BA5
MGGWVDGWMDVCLGSSPAWLNWLAQGLNGVWAWAWAWAGVDPGSGFFGVNLEPTKAAAAAWILGGLMVDVLDGSVRRWWQQRRRRRRRRSPVWRRN